MCPQISHMKPHLNQRKCGPNLTYRASSESAWMCPQAHVQSPILISVRLVTWRVNLAQNLEFVRHLTIHTKRHFDSKSDKQRSVFDWKTRTATQWWSIWEQFHVHWNTLVLPCGFVDQISASACLLSFVDIKLNVWFPGYQILKKSLFKPLG